MVLATNQSFKMHQLRPLVLPLRHGLPAALSPAKVAMVLTGISLVRQTHNLQQVSKVSLFFTGTVLKLPVPMPVVVKLNLTQQNKELSWLD
jgi:hypothetical protein